MGEEYRLQGAAEVDHEGYGYLGETYAKDTIADQYKRSADTHEVRNPSKVLEFLGGTLPNPRARKDIENAAEVSAKRPMFAHNNLMPRTALADRISGMIQ